MKLLYIVGMGRSGSTLLDILLDAHSQVTALGGVRRLAHYANRHPCPCGASSFAACPFWSTLDQTLSERLGASLTTVQVNSRDSAVFAEHNRTLFETAAEIGGTEYVTDNSKSVSRLKRLMQRTDIEVIPIHVLRDPRGRAQSLRRRQNQDYLPTFSYSHRSLRLFALLYNRPHIVVNYDRLAADPQLELSRLMERLGLAFEPGQLEWAWQAHHNIGSADVLRKTEGSVIQPDNAWQERMPRHVQYLVQCIASPGKIANDIKERRWGCETALCSGSPCLRGAVWIRVIMSAGRNHDAG